MTGQSDLAVDTVWLRRAASTLQDTAQQFSTGATAVVPGLTHGCLGQSAGAATAVDLVNARTRSAAEATAQLGSIASGLADRITATAIRFEQAEAVLRGHPR